MTTPPTSASTPPPSTPPVPTSEAAKRQRWLDAYLARSGSTLAGLAFVYLITYSVQSIWPERHDPWYIAMTVFGNVIWAIFAADLLLRFVVTPDRHHFFRKNWLDTITVVFPQFRALRTLRAFTKNGILSRYGGLNSGAAISATLGTVIVVWIGSLMVLDAERGHAHAQIVNVGDAVWWTFETITTVGYGDFVPVTGFGRMYAVLVMFAGISIVGVVSASLAAWFVKQGGWTSGGSSASASNAPSGDVSSLADPSAASDDASSAAPPAAGATSPETTDGELLAEVRELKAMVASLQSALATSTPAPPAS